MVYILPYCKIEYIMKHVSLFSQAVHYQTLHLNEVGAAMHHSIFSNNRPQRNLEERILPGGGNSSTASSSTCLLMLSQQVHWNLGFAIDA